MICHTKWKEGRESAKKSSNHKQNVIFIQKSESIISKQKLSVMLDSVSNGIRVRARAKDRNRKKNLARAYTHTYNK